MGFFHCSLPSVEYMECDIGQTEFTPPGCVSLSNVTEPILGKCFAVLCSFQKPVSFPPVLSEQRLCFRGSCCNLSKGAYRKSAEGC